MAYGFTAFPRDVYSRPPLTSEGCVVTSNRTLNKLKKYVVTESNTSNTCWCRRWIKRNEWHQNKNEANIKEANNLMGKTLILSDVISQDINKF